MNQADLTILINHVAGTLGLDANLCLAIAQHETGLDSSKTRYEPQWNYFCFPRKFANQLGISELTEKILQAISWGPLQVMGAVTRELGYTGQLSLLVEPELGTLFGCRKLKSLSEKYSDEKDVISSFNAGGPRMVGGIYSNQP